MGIIVSPRYALAASESAHAWKPVIGWQSVVTFDNIEVDSETTNYPGTNLTNPATNLKWVSGSTAEQFITTLFTSSDEIDYAAIARHNLGSEQIAVTVEGLPPGDDPEVDGDWDELVPQQLLADDKPALFRFESIYLDGLRFRLASASVAPQAAIFRVGTLMALQNGLPVGHTPINMGRRVKTAAPRAQNGDYLGQVTLTAGLQSSIEQRDMDPAWYRANLDLLRDAGPGQTFFWAWSPQNYPTEVGFCWTTSDPIPVINQRTGEIDITFPIAGLAV